MRDLRFRVFASAAERLTVLEFSVIVVLRTSMALEFAQQI